MRRLVLAGLLLAGTAAAAPNECVLPLGFDAPGNDRDLPENWEPLHFDGIERHTEYEVLRRHEAILVQARSENAASGIIRKRPVDLREWPVLEWCWKVDGVLEKGDVRTKSGDDYPARIYVTFEYDSDRVGWFERAKFETIRLAYGEYPPVAALNYIWANQAEEGLVVANAYTGRAMMITVESGAEQAGEWRCERRNVLADYREAFESEPPRVSGVAIMTDTDDTGESATAWYRDLRLRKVSDACRTDDGVRREPQD